MTETADLKRQARILIAGCGDLGGRLAQLLAQQGMRVIGLRRRPAPSPKVVELILGDVTRPGTLAGLAQTDPQILVYCVSADTQSDENYRAQYVDGLRNVLDALKPARHLRHVFFVSSTRVYGQADDEPLTEDSPAEPADFGGRRLLEAERLLGDAPCPGTVLRLSGIYGPGRHYLLDLASRPRDWPPRNGWTNRIHRDDAAGFIAFLIRRVLDGQPVNNCYLVTDSCPVPQYEVLDWIAGQTGVDTRGKTAPPPAGGKKLCNARLRSTGFELRYGDYRAGYADLIERCVSGKD